MDSDGKGEKRRHVPVHWGDAVVTAQKRKNEWEEKNRKGGSTARCCGQGEVRARGGGSLVTKRGEKERFAIGAPTKTKIA